MTVQDRTDIYQQAVNLLKENDRGTYTVPTQGLYPFQWNWDSCLTALGQSHFDEARAWTEIETLFDHQWPDGMVPHIIFHAASDSYFPGPSVWATQRPTPTSGITQPPVAGFAIRRLYDRARDKMAASSRVQHLLPKADAWHRWFFANRDPLGEGLVAILHPWESGRDNSIDWDEALARVPTQGVTPYIRRDTSLADPQHRPTNEQYDRYIWLVEHFRAQAWDNTRLHDTSPFCVIDPGFNAILIRSCTDLADLADVLGEAEIARDNRARAKQGLRAMQKLWSKEHQQYLCKDRTTGKLINSASIGGLLPIFTAIPTTRATAIAKTVEKLAAKVAYVVPSHNPSDPRFEAKRYWRGPVWLVMNYMIADGLKAAGATKIAEKIIEGSIEMITRSEFAEYYDPTDGSPCGGGRFSWTAAMILEFLEGQST